MGAGNRDVVVIGAGVVGATTAWTLADRDWNVELWSDRPTEQTTSVVAAAIWRPYRASPEANVLRWAKRTFDVLEELSDVRESAVLMRQGIELGRAMMSDPPWHTAVRSFRHARNEELRPGFIDGLVYTVPVVTMNEHLPWLLRGLTAKGVRITSRRVASLAEIAADRPRIVNAAGLAARELANDDSVYPVRGQVLRVNNPGLTDFCLDYDNPLGLTYVVPRGADVILGGTDQEGNWSTLPTDEDAAAILARCRELVPRLTDARVLDRFVGLRPARPSVRVERELTPDGGLIVHNYGHGGAGVTIAWGCAEYAADLLEL
jgi:D-amino-acid oxidase